MANPEHVDILKHGVEVWNRWRKENPEIRPDLNDADLICAVISGASLGIGNLRKAKLRRARLNGADLNGADLNGADLTDADLTDASLRLTNLRHANITGADITGADLSGAYLNSASLNRAYLNNVNLSGAHLADADLAGAHLGDTNLRGADVVKTNFDKAITISTLFANNDLSRAQNLSSIVHRGPSEISISTLYKSGANIPKGFLRGCGLSDWQIENVKLFNPNLNSHEITEIQYRIHDLRVRQAVQIKPLFISYSHSDGLFVDSIEPHLNKRGIRFWRDTHHATAGRLEHQIDRAIRLHPVVLLILSANSVASDWVQHEARLARKLELETKGDVLCPIALDEAWKICDWPQRLREQIMEYNILDFSQWQDQSQFDRMFAKLIGGLGIFYK